ncbi:MAG TPA: LemA family protein [Candidatus Caccopulliclostridium gallistercoris]|uniref:LemA family protein n=1 Tax=Candidatus Caccopulliclostridium gallistercoris TaxID=2840719 RepID=A0A9D1NF91_9FIRM|nr:LemA family protein [Candidatus Caccopulliclostridium gallistercoris]
MLGFISTGAIVGIVIAAVVVLLVVIIVAWIISTYNAFIRLRNNVEEGFSTMDVYMKKRYDLIPNLVETVKGYAKHEEETLSKVIQARNMAMNSATAEEQMKNDNILTGTLKSLFAVSEAYPELQANQNFLDLQNQLKTLETEIANSRKYYNGVVKVYENKREVFPSNLIAKWFKFEEKPFYEVDNEEERKNVKVQF